MQHNELIVRKRVRAVGEKPSRKDYLHNGMFIKRYETRQGKWGTYIFDLEKNMPVDLQMTIEKLNRLELRTEQLR